MSYNDIWGFFCIFSELFHNLRSQNLAHKPGEPYQDDKIIYGTAIFTQFSPFSSYLKKNAFLILHFMLFLA